MKRMINAFKRFMNYMDNAVNLASSADPFYMVSTPSIFCSMY